VYLNVYIRKATMEKKGEQKKIKKNENENENENEKLVLYA
jgi:hypothetical protein